MSNMTSGSPGKDKLLAFIQVKVSLRQILHLAHGVSWQVPMVLQVSTPSAQVQMVILAFMLHSLSVELQSEAVVHCPVERAARTNQSNNTDFVRTLHEISQQTDLHYVIGCSKA